MGVVMDDKITIRNADELVEHGVTWNHQPEFEFATEADALQTVEVLSNQLRAAREHERQVMRWLKAAIPAARYNGEGKTQPQAIINHSRLSRQTVYNILEADAMRRLDAIASKINKSLGMPRLGEAAAKVNKSFDAIAPHLTRDDDVRAKVD